VSLLGAQTRLEGFQDAPCLTTCVLSSPFDFTRGTRKIELNETDFAYDARLGVGVTYRLWLLRITGEGGGTRIGGWATPRRDGGEIMLDRDGGWGWYWRGTATVAF
jgi:hypothetical protein